MPDLDFAPVIWRLGLDVADQPTSDDPDDYPDTIWFDGGRILLTPYTGVVKVVGGNPVPFTAVSSTYEAEIDAEGYMLYRSKRVMWVTDLTSDKVNPKIGDDLATHRVTVTGATAGGVPVTLEPFDVRITAAGDGVSVVVVDGTEYPANDITRLAPVIPGAAQPIFRGERGVSVAAASIDATTGDLVFTLDDPLATELNAGPIPVTEAATTAAADATDAAALATTKADEASTSAGTATTKAGEASTSASTATTKAGEASSSATAAATAKTDAEAARDTLLGQKGAASGIAPLDGSSKVPAANLPGSSTSAQGVVELATPTETTTGTDTSRAVTPAGVKAAIDPIRDLSDPTFAGALSASTAQRLYAAPGSRPGLPQITSVITDFGPGHGWAVANSQPGDTGTGDDTTDHALGTQCLRLVTFNNNAITTYQKTGQSLDLTGKDFILWLKVDNAAEIDELNFYAGDSTMANYYLWVITSDGTPSQRTFLDGEWVPIALSFNDAAVTGSPNRASLAITRLRVRANNGQSVSFRLGGLATAATPPAFPNGVCVIGCDDGYRTIYTQLRPMLDKYGWGATAYVIVDRVDTTATYVTLDQLIDLERNHGWEIAGHAWTLADHATGYGNMTEPVAEASLRQLKEWLAGNNAQGHAFEGRDHFAYPLGSYSAISEKVVGKYFGTARTVVNRLKETLPPSHPLRIRSLSVSNTMTLASVKAAVDKIAAYGGLLDLTFHDIVTPATLGPQWTVEDTQAIIDYIAASGIEVMTLGKLVDRLKSPKAITSTATAVADAKAEINPITSKAQGNSSTTIQAMRRVEASTGVTTASGRMDVVTFAPAEDKTVAVLSACSGGAAWTGATLVKLGLFTVDAAGNFTLVGATANDTTLFTSTNTVYSRVLRDVTGTTATPYTLLAGQRYAIGILGVGQTAGSLRGASVLATLASRSPHMGGTYGSGLADLPTSGAIAAASTLPWAEVSTV